MPKIISVSTYNLPNEFTQETTTEFARELFQDNFRHIERLLTVFQNGQIRKRHFSVPLDWFDEPRSLKERNDLYIELATEYGARAIEKCLSNERFLEKKVDVGDIEAIFYISSTGLSTPSIDARIMNRLPFSLTTKRIPIWGLGCAGGASGLSRAFEYCKAFPEAKVLVLSVELCSLTFQRNDRSKSNLIGTSLFADGIACALVVGDEVKVPSTRLVPMITMTESKFLPKSEDIMGWDVKDDGLFVVFSRDIPQLIHDWLGPVVEEFLNKKQLLLEEIDHFIAHPGGKKVLDSYEEALQLSSEKTAISREVLAEYGNMSSPTILYVLKRFMEGEVESGDLGLMVALGPGFFAEMLLLQWNEEG